MLNVNQTTQALDLAQALRDEQGTYIARQGGQNYLVRCASGHSIVSGPTPLGPPIAGFVQVSTLAPEPWAITKISDQVDQQGFDQQQGRGQGR